MPITWKTVEQFLLSLVNQKPMSGTARKSETRWRNNQKNYDGVDFQGSPSSRACSSQLNKRSQNQEVNQKLKEIS